MSKIVKRYLNINRKIVEKSFELVLKFTFLDEYIPYIIFNFIVEIHTFLSDLEDRKKVKTFVLSLNNKDAYEDKGLNNNNNNEEINSEKEKLTSVKVSILKIIGNLTSTDDENLGEVIISLLSEIDNTTQG